MSGSGRGFCNHALLTGALYELSLAGGEQWRLSDEQVLDASGARIDPWYFNQAERLEVADPLTLAVSTPGPPLDVTFTTLGVIVATERIASLVGDLAADDIQRIPARVHPRNERYEVLNVLARIDCIDWEHTRATARVDDELKVGTLASLGELIERDFLARHVVGWEMTLKAGGIEGARIFRVTGWDVWPMVTEDLKVALEEAGASGLTYKPMRTSA